MSRFVFLRRHGRPSLVVPETTIGAIEIDDANHRGVVEGVDGGRLGTMDRAAALTLCEDTVILPAQPGWLLITSAEDEDGVTLFREAVVAWRVDRSATLGGVIPVVVSWETNQSLEPSVGQEPYLVLPPEGWPTDSQGSIVESRADDGLARHLVSLKQAAAGTSGAGDKGRTH